jgi:ATP-dependent helicase HrpB
MPALLPIHAIRDELLDRVRATGRAVVRAPTGSGKSTQVPQMLLDGGLAGDGQIVVLQPRRIAARLLAARVARERGGRLGDEVGYQVRLDDVSSAATRIKYETEGILLRRLLSDPLLRGVSAVIFDEFHERHLFGDLTLARALELQASRRPDLRLLVMSATLRVEPLEDYLRPCAVVASEGRAHPVEIVHLDRTPDERAPVWELAADAYERAVRGGAEGDALIFMPGAYEIARTIDALGRTSAGRGVLRLPLHGELPPAEQDAAVAPHDRRKVVVATNVAETSLTIEGVRIVIDSGLARIPRHDPRRGLNTLLVEKISRASADQRAGRAGRTAPGVCLRLWTLQDHRSRALEEEPEIRRLELSEAVLTLKASGLTDLSSVRWLDPPPAPALQRAESLLRDLGALDAATGAVTGLGRRMIAFPAHPRCARMLIEAGARGCVAQAALAAALTQGRGLLVRRADRWTKDNRDEALSDEAESDFFILMRAWRHADRCGYDVESCRRLGIHAQAARQVRPIRDALLRIARAEGLPIEDHAPPDEALQRCLLAGFADHVARRMDEGTLRCRLARGGRGVLARDSAVRRHPLIVAAEVTEVEGRDLEVILSLATAIREEWLRELFPGDFSERIETRYDRAARRAVGERQVLFRDLALAAAPADPDPEAAARLLADEVTAGRLALKGWTGAVEQWIARVNFVAGACPELGWTPVGDGGRRLMIEQICHGAASAKDLAGRDAWPAVRSWLAPGEAARLDGLAPEQIALPGGGGARVVYAAGGPPKISKRIQDLYGLRETPRLAMGRVPLTIEILGPNFRPVQVTQDLAAFWRERYPHVKKELRRRYPRHEWR